MVLTMREFISKIKAKLEAIEWTNDLKFVVAANVSATMIIAFVAALNESAWVFLGGIWLLVAVDILGYGMSKLNINT